MKPIEQEHNLKVHHDKKIIFGKETIFSYAILMYF
jgi:hypothetical protein